MKSIREKVQTDYPKSDILEEEMTRICYRVGFEKGANYVLEQIEQALTPQKCLTDIGINVGPEALIKTALQTIEQLKEE